jgi:hypothetical protein
MSGEIVHTFRKVWLCNINGRRSEGLACSCQRNAGDHCPALEKHYLAEGLSALMAAIASSQPLPAPEEIDSDEGGPHAQ